MTYQLIRGDATALPIEDDSVDAVITSPPYYSLRSYTDGGEHYDGQIGSEATPQAFLEALWAVTAECRRVLKPSGSLFCNLGDKYSGGRGGYVVSGGGYDGTASKSGARSEAVPGFRPKTLLGLPWRYAIGCIDQLGLILRAEIVWAKPNGLPESVTDRVRRSHEQWFHFTKEPRYFSAVDEIREAHENAEAPNARRGPSGPNRGTVTGRKHDDGASVGNFNHSPLGKLPGSVWTVPTEPLRVPDHLGVDHFAAFPSEWPRRLILGWSPSGICVECGQGRRPVTELDPEYAAYRKLTGDWNASLWSQENGYDGSGNRRTDGKPMTRSSTITGYACACPDTTAPTRPSVILDPFCGTGTVPAVAHALGRHGIGIDLSADYLRLAEWRCNDPALRAKVLRVDKPKAVPDGQLDIFGGRPEAMGDRHPAPPPAPAANYSQRIWP